jgi:hypothetical protein
MSERGHRRIMYQHLALVILKSMGLAVMIRRRCQAKTIFGRPSKRHGTYVPCSVSGTDYASIFSFAFFRCVVAAATMLCSPTNSRLWQFRATGVQHVSLTVAIRTQLRNHMKRRDNSSLQPVAPGKKAAPATTFSVQASPLPRSLHLAP